MNEYTTETQVADVLDAYMTAAAGPDWSTLVEWIRRYPQFEQELTEFAVAWSRLEALPAPPALSAAEAEQQLQRGMTVVRGILNRGRPASAAPIRSLLEAGRAHGLSPQQLAKQTDLSVSVIMKLERRLIRFASIPGELLERLARAVELDSSAILRYLQGSARLPAGASYRAEQAPRVPPQQEFGEAIRTDPLLGDEQRRRWLALLDPAGDAEQADHDQGGARPA